MPEAKKPEDDPTGGAAGAAEGDKAPESDPPKQITMTQEDLDAMIASRLARAKPKDYDELVALRDKVKAEEDEKKTEDQKAKDAAKEREKKAEERELQANQKLIKAEIVAQATAQKASDTEIVVALLMGAEGIEVDDSGNVTGAKEAVAKLLKDKPVLKQGAGGPGGRPDFGGNDPKDNATKIAELEQKALDPQLTSQERQRIRAEARELKISAYTGA